MTVGQLIEELRRFDSGSEVIVRDLDGMGALNTDLAEDPLNESREILAVAAGDGLPVVFLGAARMPDGGQARPDQSGARP